MSEYAVEIQNLVKTYHMGQVDVLAIQGVNLQIQKGIFSAIIGPSGCGKTSVLNMIGGIDEPTSGRILIDGKDISQQDDRERSHFRAQKLGFIFQSFHLIPVLNVFENIAYPMNICNIPKDVIRERVEELISMTKLEGCAGRRPSELSGGQRQRVAIARSLAMDPILVIADEPTANLDSHTGKHILDLLHEMKEKRGVTFIFCTHDPIIVSYADVLYHMLDGRIISTEELKKK